MISPNYRPAGLRRIDPCRVREHTRRVDDQRQFWNPGGVFVEAAANYLRRPDRSRFWTVCVVVVLATTSLAIVGAVVLSVIGLVRA